MPSALEKALGSIEETLKQYAGTVSESLPELSTEALQGQTPEANTIRRALNTVHRLLRGHIG
jgi:hypothetical protein